MKVSLVGPDHPDFILDDYPLYNLNRTSATYIEQMSLRLKAFNMDQPSWRVLMLLGDKNPSSVGVLSRRSVTKISTITRILMRMKKKTLSIGFLIRMTIGSLKFLSRIKEKMFWLICAVQRMKYINQHLTAFPKTI